MAASSSAVRMKFIEATPTGLAAVAASLPRPISLIFSS
jgi:hypothetical protein